jgi:glycosyltransferase involved in cell wall biosynthesis
MQRLDLSVLVPVYNEQSWIDESLDRIRLQLSRLGRNGISGEAIIVDDGSSDRSGAAVEHYIEGHRDFSALLLRHPVNRGKGSAVRTALEHARGNFCIIQDADLEYDPADYASLLHPLLANEADLVIGSRVSCGRAARLRFPQRIANLLLSALTSAASGRRFSDAASGYKAFRASMARSIPFVSERFGLDFELPIKFARRSARIREVPIRYRGRGYQEGKKIKARDVLPAVTAILKASLTSAIHTDPAVSMLCAMERAVRFNRWMAHTIAPYIHGDVLEIGAGIGNLTRLLCRYSHRYTVTDVDAEHLEHVTRMLSGQQNLSTAVCDVSNRSDFESFAKSMDTVICLNVLEHVADDVAGLQNIHSSLKPGGRAIILVPQNPSAFGSLDGILGHLRRYTKAELEDKIIRSGFFVEKIFTFNRSTYPGWLLNAKLLRRRHISRIQLALFDSMVPILRRIDSAWPWPATSLIAICGRDQ